MEATVSSEHRTREEMVAEEQEKPRRGRGRRRAPDAELEINAPTAAAAASEAGLQAILAEAEVEPGPQLPVGASS